MKNNKTIILLFYLFPFFLILHLAYGLIVREPYPSFIMPGFSRIDINQGEYTLKDYNLFYYTDGIKDSIELKELAYPFSKIAIVRAIDLAYFSKQSEENYNSIQKKYYTMIKSIIGEDQYTKYIIKVRYPTLDKKDKIEFTEWIKKTILMKREVEVSKIIIQKILITRLFKSGEIKHKKVIGVIEI